jgi:hypothetical protein
VGQVPARALDLFDLGWFASDGEPAMPVPCQKHPRKSPPVKAVPKPFNAPAAKAASCGVLLFICLKAIILTFALASVVVKSSG